jgi:hypothetical protein
MNVLLRYCLDNLSPEVQPKKVFRLLPVFVLYTEGFFEYVGFT